jgi:hypothetical protein
MKKIPWYRQKTTWSGFGVILPALLGLFTDVLTPEQITAIMAIFGGLTAIFLRQGVEKAKENKSTDAGKILPILFICTVFLFAACAHMTPAQKYAATRTAYNEMVKSYIAQAKLQPDAVRAKLKEEANPVIKEAEAALDAYYAALSGTLPGGDPEERLLFYLKLKNEILKLCLKYGLEVHNE